MLKNLFRKKTESDKLHKEYEKLMQEYFRLSSINRTESDSKFAEAQKVADKIVLLKTQK
jgi:hypothetical protein